MADTFLTTIQSYTQLSETTTTRLHTFCEVIGKDAFPRAFTDILEHLNAISDQTSRAKRDHEANNLNLKRMADIQHVIEGCTRQLKSFKVILDRCLPGNINSGNKGIPKAIKDIYKEKDIPRIQKSLHGFQMSLADA